jgi:hypothetical protein
MAPSLARAPPPHNEAIATQIVGTVARAYQPRSTTTHVASSSFLRCFAIATS